MGELLLSVSQCIVISCSKTAVPNWDRLEAFRIQSEQNCGLEDLALNASSNDPILQQVCLEFDAIFRKMNTLEDKAKFVRSNNIFRAKCFGSQYHSHSICTGSVAELNIEPGVPSSNDIGIMVYPVFMLCAYEPISKLCARLSDLRFPSTIIESCILVSDI